MTFPDKAGSREARSDEALVAAAAEGEAAAFEELYRRHHVVATRVANRVTRNRDDAGDAASEAFTRVFAVVSSGGLRNRSSFRSYLLTTARRIAIDKVHQRDRVRPTDQIESFDGVSAGPGPAEEFLRSENERLVIEAFKHLPRRSQSVLWLVDVERVPAQEAAEALGLTPNNVAQIAVRARRRLRHSYVRAHLAAADDVRCRFTVEHMGSYLDGGLRPASVDKVDAHLSECERCRNRLDQLRDAGLTIRRALLPVLLLRRLTGIPRRLRRRRAPGGVPPSAELSIEAGAANSAPFGANLAAAVYSGPVVDLVQGLRDSPAMHRAVAAVITGIIAASASSLALKSDEH
ncbi:MAG: sigma-70 family RNA polymerase sigma factor, partial [Actinobacteria bacterium]|nr:sigma-70 family RNA polymerase sigma factor [Actinomycetota bacterium]